MSVGPEARLIGANEHNEAGYWEHATIQAIDRKMLTEYGYAYDDLSALPTGWREFPNADKLTRDFKKVIESDFGGRPIWGWKDPLNCGLMEWHKACLTDLGVSPLWVICVRNPWDVASSLEKRDQKSRLKAYGMWLRYTLNALAGSMGGPRALVLFESLMSDARQSLAPVIALKDDWEPGEEAWNAAVQGIQPGLNHGHEVPDGESLPSLVSRTFELFRLAASDQRSLLAGSYDGEIRALATEFDEMEAMTAPPSPPRGLLTIFHVRSGKIERADLEYEPVHGFQTLSVSVENEGGGAMGGILYHLPGVVWIRGATWSGSGGKTEAVISAGSGAVLESSAGIRRLWITGALEQFILTAPSAPGRYTLELEVMVDCRAAAISDCVRAVQAELGLLVNRSRALEGQSAQLESRVSSLTRQLNELRAAAR